MARSSSTPTSTPATPAPSLSFTNYPASNTVVALTRPATLAELLQAGTLSSSAFSSLTNSAGGTVRPRDLTTTLDFPLDFTVPLGQVLYQDANFLVETLPSSQLDLNATLHLAANFQWFKLTAIQAQLSGTASFELDVHARAALAENFANSIPLITPIHNVYGAFIGPVPVWVDVVFEVNAGYTANFSASAEITNGIGGVKTISVGKKWDAVSGCAGHLRQPAGEPDPPRPDLAGAGLCRRSRLPPAQGLGPHLQPGRSFG